LAKGKLGEGSGGRMIAFWILAVRLPFLAGLIPAVAMLVKQCLQRPTHRAWTRDQVAYYAQ
jgi:hypothetical protein